MRDKRAEENKIIPILDGAEMRALGLGWGSGKVGGVGIERGVPGPE